MLTVLRLEDSDVMVWMESEGRAGISTSVGRFVGLDEREWKWLVETAGPQVLAEMRKEQVR